MPTRIKITLAIIAICLVWGSTWLAIKLGLLTVPPMLAASLRFFIATIILWVMMMAQGLTIPRERVFFKLVVIVSLSSFSIPYALVYWGQMKIHTGLASILFATFPFWVALFSQISLPEEKMTMHKAIGIVLGFGGVLIIFYSGLQFESREEMFGMGAVIASSFLQAFSLVALKKEGRGYSPVTLNFSSMSISAVILAVGSYFLEDHKNTTFDATALVSLAYLSTIGTVFTFVTYFWLLKHVEAVLLSLTAFVTPVIAIVLGYIVLHELQARNVFLGAAFVLGGIVFANGGDLWAIAKRGKSLLRE